MCFSPIHAHGIMVLKTNSSCFEQDWTDDFLADLVAAGVPRKDVVLAFTPPETRAMTEFAVA